MQLALSDRYAAIQGQQQWFSHNS